MLSRTVRVLMLAALAATVLTFAPAATAGPAGCDTRDNNTPEKLLQCVTLAGVREHQAAFQDIADNNGGTRAAGTQGYEDSVDYVIERMTAAGYNVSTVEFPFVFVPPPTLTQLTPVNATYATGAFSGSFSGDVNAAVTPVDINLVPPRANTSGCDGAYTEAAVGAPILSDPAGPNDFSGFPAGNIALLQRGGCSFALKAHNAVAAGAAAVIIFNQGDTPARSVTFVGNATAPA
ncbi:MAG TPA: PA domain-containing protein, partial [Roseiflexaceae bacterium]|nr:PA domain-containing protein [Roseiflexaceae bacterium]